MPAKVRHQPIDPLADPDTGKRIVFPKIKMRLSYEDIMGQRRPTLGPGSPDYITVYRQRTPPRKQDQSESNK